MAYFPLLAKSPPSRLLFLHGEFGGGFPKPNLPVEIWPLPHSQEVTYLYWYILPSAALGLPWGGWFVVLNVVRIY